LEKFPNDLPASVIEQLQHCNQPTSCVFPRQSLYKLEQIDQEGERGKKNSKRFTFDYLDTVRYRFAPLGRVFGYSAHRIAQRATRWVCDLWGRTDQDVRQDPRTQRYEHQWQLMAGGQGSVPKIENLQQYLEYHALHCVTGEMIDERQALVLVDYDEPECPWESWLKSEVNSGAACWLSDLRSPTPLLPECWGSWPEIEEWLRKRPPEDYDAGLGLLEPEHRGEIVIAGYIDLWDTARHGDIHISSALVESERALALLRALQTTENPHNFNLTMEIDDPDFELKNLYIDRQSEEGLDEFDPLCRNVPSGRWTPSADFNAAMKLTPVPGKLEHKLPDGTVAARLEIWSDQSEHNRERIYEMFSEGQRLWLRIDTLLEYLNQCARDLIIEVKIARRNRNDHQKEEKYDCGSSTIYLLRRCGKLETLLCSRDLRATDCARTRLRK
jgi:hypothetical protein